MKKHAFSMEINMCQKGWWWSTSKDCSTVLHTMTWMQLKFVDLCESATLNLSQNITWATWSLCIRWFTTCIYGSVTFILLQICNIYLCIFSTLSWCSFVFCSGSDGCLLSTYSFHDYCFYFKIIGPLLCLIYFKVGCFIIWLVLHKLWTQIDKMIFKSACTCQCSFFSPLQSIHKKYRQVFFLLRHLIIIVLNICIGAD